jgi:hypothetical protein
MRDHHAWNSTEQLLRNSSEPHSIPSIAQGPMAGNQKTNGIMGFVGKSYSGQIVHVYSVIQFNTPRKRFVQRE